MSDPVRREPPDDHSGQEFKGRQGAAAALRQWMARPRRVANVRALAAMCLTMLLLAVTAANAPERNDLLRGVAVFFSGIHFVLHATWVRWLKQQLAAGIPEAAAALQAYRDPRRITGLDVAMAWLGFAALAPTFAALFTADAPNGG
jgi:hypothetical protein